uniref:Uncharacterized protein n=1 Tax=viral metagenome TaxID=1070528 RepID=A0A6M3M312_9ZZZZ
MGQYVFAIEKSERETAIPQQKAVEASADAVLFGMNRYESFLKEMNSCSLLKKARGMICDNDDAYIQTFTVKSGTSGKVIELRCPESNAISVFGKNQNVLLLENEPKEFDINDPYFFSVGCFDEHNRELDPATRMNFKKVSKSKHGGISRICRAFYGDLLPAKAVRYSFPEGLYLSGDEVLELEVLNPDIDIERIELSMEADIFEAVGQAC